MDTIFLSCPYSSEGMMAINKKGQVLSVTLDEKTAVSFVSNQLQNPDLAVKLATRCNFSGSSFSTFIHSYESFFIGADDLVIQNFDMLFSNGKYREAAILAATSPNGVLRTPETIRKFQHCATPATGPSPLLQYFGILLESSTLNKHETLELCRPVVAQGRKELISKWLNEQKLECCEELGDLIKPHDVNIALSIYLRGSIYHKVAQTFAETNQFDKLVLYGRKTGFHPDFLFYLRQVIRNNDHDNAVKFAKLLADKSEHQEPLADLNSVSIWKDSTI